MGPAPAIVTSVVSVMFLVLGFVMFYFGFPCPVTLGHQLHSLHLCFPPQLHSISNHLPSVFSFQVPSCSPQNPHRHLCLVRFCLMFFTATAIVRFCLFFIVNLLAAQPQLVFFILNKSSFIFKYLHPGPNLPHATHVHPPYVTAIPLSARSEKKRVRPGKKRISRKANWRCYFLKLAMYFI